jgi:hypothetical protein
VDLSDEQNTEQERNLIDLLGVQVLWVHFKFT